MCLIHVLCYLQASDQVFDEPKVGTTASTSDGVCYSSDDESSSIRLVSRDEKGPIRCDVRASKNLRQEIKNMRLSASKLSKSSSRVPDTSDSRPSNKKNTHKATR